MTSIEWISVAVFILTCAVIGLIWVWRERDNLRIAQRVRRLSEDEEESPREEGGLLASLIPRMGEVFLSKSGGDEGVVRARLTSAGFYSPRTVAFFRGIQVVMSILCTLAGFALAATTGLVRPSWIGGIAGLAVGIILPGLWLEQVTKKWRIKLRRAWPDCLDMLVLCMEGGVSLRGALHRVTEELRGVHPDLAGEMNLMQREIQLGLSAAEAMLKMGDRTGLAEIRDLAAVLVQSERYGASIVKTLRVHADTCRHERQMAAEERAQKAAVKILFPTLLCIFPAIFIVILGPAAYQIAKIFSPK
jgi:tight adherence protein C